MLNADEFNNLAATDQGFQVLKKEIRPHFTIWTLGLAAIALLGFVFSIFFFTGKEGTNLTIVVSELIALYLCFCRTISGNNISSLPNNIFYNNRLRQL